MLARKEQEFWRERLPVAAYGLAEAARYAGVSHRTASAWERLTPSGGAPVLSSRPAGAGLSFLQLIELGVVAAMRKAGVSLQRIRRAREYLKGEFRTEYPFAAYRLQSDGKFLFVSADQFMGAGAKDMLLSLNEHGQFAFPDVLAQRLQEFVYEDGEVRQWKVGGPSSPVLIDPRIAFGAPVVSGTPTWVIRERIVAGDSLQEIAEDFDLDAGAVEAALKFEKVVN